MADNIKQGIEKKALLIGAIVALAGAPFKLFGFSIGVVLGALISVFNFRLLAKKVELIAAGIGKPAAIFLGYIFRYILMGIVLWICINRGFSYFLGAACGLFAIRVAIYIDSFVVQRQG